MKAKWKGLILMKYFREKEDRHKNGTNKWSSDSWGIIQENIYIIDNWSFDTVLDQIITELLSKSHQAPQPMPTTTCQLKVNYGQPYQIVIISVVVVVFLVTGLWGVCELLGDDVTSSDSEPSRPRLHC